MQTDSNADDRRHYHRVAFICDALLKFPFGEIPVEVLDVSLAGALLKVGSAKSLKEGGQGALIMRLSDEVQIRINGELIVHSDGSYAIKRKLKVSEDDYHLRRLLELNLGDTDLLERDMQTLIEEHHLGDR
ncbi:MAG: PilZ domain-containing protein [Gammaproteobacteria bacterium]|nr:PilZ domain-containing protein [Gammaproteobacteria bacterium]